MFSLQTLQQVHPQIRLMNKLRSRTLCNLPNERSLISNTRFLIHSYSSVPFYLSIDDQSSPDQLISSQNDQSTPKSLAKRKSLTPNHSSQKINPVTANASSEVTLKTLKELYEKQIPITMLTAYDFATARLLGMASDIRTTEEANHPTDSKFPVGIDICLCGDSLANVCLGYHSTNELGFEEFSYHLKSIRRGLDSLKLEPNYRIPLLFADLPFGSFESSIEQGVHSATKLIQTSRVDGFKIEGGNEISPLIRKLTSFGIPIMGHIGLTPQRASSLGGFKVQGHDASSRARQIIQDGIDLEKAGCCAIVIEAVPIEIITQLKKMIQIPLIGIGAGPETDGQVLVLSDLIGILNSKNPQLGLSRKPKFVPKEKFLSSFKYDSSYNNPIFDVSTHIIYKYILDVRSRKFPITGTHTYSMKPQVLADLNQNGWSL